MIGTVYVIVVDNDRYIGSTIDIKKRVYQHQYLLDKNKHHNYMLQELFNQGLELEINILIQKEFDSDIDLRIAEQLAIEEYNPKYNIIRDVLQEYLFTVPNKPFHYTPLGGYKSIKDVQPKSFNPFINNLWLIEKRFKELREKKPKKRSKKDYLKNYDNDTTNKT